LRAGFVFTIARAERKLAAAAAMFWLEMLT